VVTESALARSEMAAVSIAYLDAYPEGFEFEVEVSTVAVERVCRNGGDSDIFGRHWPTVGDSRDVIPPQLLRIGVQFADGRKATNITGRDQPPDGPIMSPLRGGGGGASQGPSGSPVGAWNFHQGYWVSPLPPSGPVALVCEWPACGISLVRHEVEAQLILEAADRARAIFPDGQRVLGEGREWRLGSDGDVAWINDGTSPGTAITAAIPPIFASYCTLVLPQNGQAELTRHEHAVIELLTERTDEQPWWLGYLDTGASDVVFPYARRTNLYYGYRYVLVEAGPQQAANWRDSGFNWALPDLMFPADRSWLVSTMWDHDWTSIGGSEQLVSSFLHHTGLREPRARRVALGDDATPPGHGPH
jgi:hypothetical protein